MVSELGTFLGPNMTKSLDIEDTTPWSLLKYCYIGPLVRKSHRHWQQKHLISHLHLPPPQGMKNT